MSQKRCFTLILIQLLWLYVFIRNNYVVTAQFVSCIHFSTLITHRHGPLRGSAKLQYNDPFGDSVMYPLFTHYIFHSELDEYAFHINQRTTLKPQMSCGQLDNRHQVDSRQNTPLAPAVTSYTVIDLGQHWQGLACCLMAPSQYPKQCWLIIIKALLHSPESSFTGSFER